MGGKENSGFSHEKYGAEQKGGKSADLTDGSRRENRKAPIRQRIGSTESEKRESYGFNATRNITDSAEKQANGAQPLGKMPRRLAAKKRRRRKIIIFSGAILAALILIAVLIACFSVRKSDILKGTWDLDGVTVYRFDGKGAGSLDLPSNSYAFTYEIKDGILSIDFESESARDKTYIFTTDKNRLFLSDSEGKETKTFELTKRGD